MIWIPVFGALLIIGACAGYLQPLPGAVQLQFAERQVAECVLSDLKRHVESFEKIVEQYNDFQKAQEAIKK